MIDYTTPIKTTFELQRQSIQQSQQALEKNIDFQKQISDSVIGSLESQESAQRTAVEFHRDAVYSLLDALAEAPGANLTIDPIRESLDDSYTEVLDNHEEAFDAVLEEVENGTNTYDDLTEELLVALEEQVDLLVEAHEDLEAQSVEATEQIADQVDDLQEQVDDVQEQVQNVSEKAADAIEA